MNDVSVLVVAAHPDDEVLGCGGTMARMAGEGRSVHVLILGEGATSRHDRREDADAAALERLRIDAKRANGALGVADVRFAGLPDNRFDTVALLDVVKSIESLIAELRPSVVFTQHGGDLNIDHAVTFRAVLTATRPVAGSPVRAVYAYEVASSTEWAFQRFAPEFRPSLFVNIAATLEAKIRAMEAYESESRPFPHPRSPEALRAVAARWGSVVGLASAEAFDVIREVRP